MNKHHHGFVRLALVPRDRFEAHEKHAFHLTCYETGECEGKVDWW